MSVAYDKIVPVILSGGSGTRLWPMSTPHSPKQFLPLVDERTMFEHTLARCSDAQRFAAPVIVANARHGSLIDTQLGTVEDARLILEPCARNTAPAIALAAIACGAAPMLVMPSDHVIADQAAFMRAVETALPLARDGWMVTFGITPDAPETGYGYIRIGEEVAPGAHRVDRFIEKPPQDKAQAMLAEGGHAWNGGIFLFRGDAFMAELDKHQPAMAAAARAAMDAADVQGRHVLPQEAAFAASPSESIDYAVMEKAERVAVVPVAMGWSDVGSWDALYAVAELDASGNALGGDVQLISGSGNLVRGNGIRVSIAGVDNLIVVAHGNEVLILPRGASQDVKKFAQ